MTTTYYPPSPELVRKKLTTLTVSYQLRAFLAILSILVFFALYAALVAALGFLLYFAIIYDIGDINKFTIILKVGAISGAAMLFAFTLKFILKLKNHTPENRIKLHEKDHKELWGFINQICQETGAPKPKSIYVDPDVNAYVSYTNTWLSLFLPVQKELTIGMGLVDCLNLTEFKAVVSHEFGHFAQRSMKIGSYIISANTIIHDMIFSRDKYDELLDKWRGSDIRVSVAAWVITPIIWLIRQVLSLFYRFLNIMHSSLSREMEFNADKVAVSTSGSDAIISALWKLDGGSAQWNNTLNNAYLASQKNNFVRNLYFHNTLAIAREADKQQELLFGLPDDPRGGKRYFTTSENSRVNMYVSHPPNDKRENNAKIPYIEGVEDSRSPWILFGKKEQLQESMTNLIYKAYLNKNADAYITPAAFEEFIQAETRDTELFDEYANTFENRFLHIPDKDVLEMEVLNLESLDTSTLQKLKNHLGVLMKPVAELEALMIKAQQIAEGSTRENAFSIHGITYNKKNLHQGYEYLLRQREKLFEESFTDWDTSFCSFHYALAKKVGKEKVLLNHYFQHRAIVQVYKAISETKKAIYSKVAEAQERVEVTEEYIVALTYDLNKLFTGLNPKIQALDRITFVPLPNIETLHELKHAIIDRGSFKEVSGKIFENGGLDKIFDALDNAMMNCQRIDQKSIGGILMLHKGIQKETGLPV